MTHTRLLALLFALLSAFPALGIPAIEAPAPGEALYLVVLGERPTEPDVTALGGRLIQSWSDRRLVAIPRDRLADLQSQPGVSYVQRVWTGEQETTQRRRTIRSETATPMSRVTAPARISANTAPPQWTTGVYQYDGSGNIKSMGDDSYKYDYVGRITYSDVKGEQKSYEFDPYGNLLKLGTQPVSVNQTNNRLTTIPYDAVGNMKTDAAGRKYVYDPLGMVTAIDVLPTDHDDMRMIYSADDERIVISEGATTRYRMRDFNNKVLREWKSTADGIPEWQRDYIYAEGTLVAGEVQVDQSRNGMRHYHLDQLDSTRLVTDGARQLVAEHNYEPFGRELGSTITEYQNTSTAPRDPLKFTGHERDYFSGADMPGDYVDYMHARYYTPIMGRFLSVDPYLDLNAAMADPQSWNRYSYVANNPVGYTDPTGRNAWNILGKGAYYVLAYSKKHGEKLVATIVAKNKKEGFEQIKTAIREARTQGSHVSVVTPTSKKAEGLADALSANKKSRGPEKHGAWPTHHNPETGEFKDVHVQTLDDTKKAGLGKDLLSLVAGTTLATTADADASPSEIVSAALWDTAKAIDPIFLTDAIEYATGLDEYTNPPR